MSLSISHQRPLSSQLASLRSGASEEDQPGQDGSEAARAPLLQAHAGATQSGPSPFLLARDAAARNFWNVRALEVLQAAASTGPAPEGLNEQERYDYYADTPEGRAILDVEGDLYSSGADTRALLVARAQFLRGEGGGELFNDLNPRRASLSGEALAAYDAEVEVVMDELRTEATYTLGGAEHPDAVPDESMLYIMASQIVDKHGGSAERLEAVMEDIDSWIISIDNGDGVPVGGGLSGGWYWANGGTTTLQIALPNFISSIAGPDTYYDVLAHELAHSLDYVDGAGDGIPVGMTEADAAIVRRERERLFELAYPGENVDPSQQQDFGTVVDNSGLTDYAFSNEKEFWARGSELFLGTDASREALRTASPELYDVMRRYYDRTDLPAAGETEIDDPAMRADHVTGGATYQDIDGELFVDGPDVFDVQQGRLADCYFLAALGALAHTNPQALRDMVTDNGDGTFTVHFGGEAGDVTVDDDFAVDGRGRALYAGTGETDNPELWVAVIEKAFAQVEGGYTDIEYGWAHEAIAFLTGHDDFTVRAPSGFTSTEIGAALDEGRTVTASSYSGETGDKKNAENGIVSNHVYVVLGVRERNGATEVRVYNPWGSTEGGIDDGENDGAFWMSLEDFNTSFRQVEMMNTALPQAA